MVRPTVDTTLPAVALQPQAAPVDTYVRPAVDQNAGAGLMDIARSLQSFSKPLGDMIAQRDAKAKEDDALKAQRDFVSNNSLGYDEAVKKGLIPASASPTYVAAWKKAQGDVAGSQLEQEALAAYEQSPLKNSTDPNALNQFVSGFLKDRMGTTDPEVLKGLMPRVHAIRTAIYNRHLQDQDTLIKGQSQNLLGAQGANAIDDAHAQGLASGEPNYGAAFKAIQDKRAAFTGMSDDEANQVIFNTVTEKAISNNDPKILDFFSLKVPGQSYSYKDTPDGLKAYNNALEKLDVISRRNKVEAHQAQTEADRKAKEKTEADALDVISKNPNAPLPDELNRSGRVYDGSWEAKVLGWRTAFKNAAAASDPYALSEVQKEIMDDPANGPRFVVEALNKGTISASDFQTTYKFAKDVQGSGSSFSNVQSNPAFEAVMKGIGQRTAESTITDPFGNPSALSDDGFRAQSDFRRQVFEWMQQHPDDAKDPLKLSKAIDELGANMFRHITGDSVTGRKYEAPAGGAGNPYGGNAPAEPPAPAGPLDAVRQGLPRSLGGTAPDPQGMPSVAPQGGAQPVAPAAPPTVGPTPQEVDGWLKSQSPIIQQTIEGQAAKAKDPEAFKRGVMEKFQRNMQQRPGAVPPGGGSAPDGTPVQKSSFMGATPISAFAGEAPTAGQAIDAAISDPQRALGAIQDALTGQTAQEDLSSAFDTALKTAPAAPQGYGPVARSISKAASELGVDPRLLATVISYETIGSFNPDKVGGKGNKYMGLIQFGPEERKQFGVRPGMSFDEQMGSVVKYLKARGFKPGMGIEDLYSTINAGSPGRYDASDGNGTVRTHVQNMLNSEHARNAMAMFDAPERSFYADSPATPQQQEFLSSKLTGGAATRSDSVSGFKPQMVSRLSAFLQSAPPEIAKGLGIYSGYRSRETQERLFAASDGSGRMVARPGGSRHEHGDAADLAWNGKSLKYAPKSVIQWVHQNAGQFGLKFPMDWENWHVELQETRGGEAFQGMGV